MTELAAHGSVWDALRQPIDPPYVAADGLSHDAWPLSLYGIDETNLPMNIVPDQQFYDPNAAKEAAGANIPFAPSGTWPFALVKRRLWRMPRYDLSARRKSSSVASRPQECEPLAG